MKPFPFLLALTLSSIPAALGWGKVGHEIVANIAYNLLTPETRNASYHILFPTDDFNATGDTSPLAAVANWADTVRFTSSFAWTTPLHYCDVKDGPIEGGCPFTTEREGNGESSTGDGGDSPCKFMYERDCGNDFCAVGAIVDFSNLSRNPERLKLNSQSSAAKTQRGLRAATDLHPTKVHNVTQRQSLMFLIHIIGDIHQPLHVARASDHGGNTIEVSFPEAFSGFQDERLGHSHKGWKLHSVWDTAIIERTIRLYHNSSQHCFQSFIEASLLTQASIELWGTCSVEVGTDSRTCPTQWAEESFNDALTYAYGDENGHEVQSGANLSEEYFETRLEIVQRRLAAGGVRLAATLEEIYGRGENDNEAGVRVFKT